ncbi:MAG: peptidylprolyl isomerase, partial [Dehalococcoidia bacterium]
SFSYQVVRDMEDAELARQKAQALGIGVPPEAVTETIDEVLLASDPSQGNLTLTQRGETYQRWLQYVDLSETEYRRIIEADLLREELLEYFKEQEVPPETEQVHLLTIARDTEEEAHAALRQLLNGNATTAQELLEGDRGWVPRGLYPEFDGYAFDLGVGNTSQPIQTIGGYNIIKVSEIDESRTIDDQHRDILGPRAFGEWLTQARLDGVVGYLNDDMIDWAIDQIE